MPGNQALPSLSIARLAAFCYSTFIFLGAKLFDLLSIDHGRRLWSWWRWCRFGLADFRWLWLGGCGHVAVVGLWRGIGYFFFAPSGKTHFGRCGWLGFTGEFRR